MAPTTKRRLESTAFVAEPTTGEGPANFIGTREAAPAPIVPASVKAEVQTALAVIVEGGRHVYRGEQASRLSVDVPPALHKALRLRCVAEEISVRDFVIRALAAAGVVEP